MSDFKWDKGSDDQITSHLLTYIQTATLGDRACLLRLDYEVDAHTKAPRREALQLRMSRDQARELAQLLLRLADAPHIPVPTTRSRH